MSQKVTFIAIYDKLKNVSYIEDEKGKLHKFVQEFEKKEYTTSDPLEIKAMKQDPHYGKNYKEKK